MRDILRKYGEAAVFDFSLYEIDGVDMRIDAVHAAGDTTVMKNEGAPANTTNGFVDEGDTYSITLTATEMECARGVIKLVDQTATKVWLDITIEFETYGHASAQHAFDLDTASVAQTGDSYTRIGVAGAGLSNIDLPNQTMDITGNLSGSVGSVTGAVASVTAAVTTDATSRTASKADVSPLALDSTVAKELTLDGVETKVDGIPTVMRGTDNAALASVATELRLAELDAANLPADVAAIPTTAMRGTDGANTTVPDVAGAAAALHVITDGKIDTVDTVVDLIYTLLNDARTEPGQIAPPINPNAVTKLDWIYKFLRNKKEETATETRLYDDADAVVDQKRTVSDDGAIATAEKWEVGP